MALESTTTLFAGLPWEAWTAVGTFVIAVGTVATWWLGRRVGEAQDRINELNTRVAELQARATWLSGALESHSELMLRLRAEELGKQVVWWDPTYDGPQKKRPPTKAEHGASAVVETVFVYLPPELRRYPDIA